MQRDLFTIGYQGYGLDAFIARLRANNVSQLVDVRAVAWSRKPGFAKRQLADALEAAGIAYSHVQALGTPKAGRAAAKSGDRRAFETLFHAHLARPEAVAAVADVGAMATAAPICLMCLERDPGDCHRTLVAHAVTRHTGQRVVDIGP
ncbi:MAG: DUF488 domain-containing protein [Alphaproteobacteria bacterium]|nr:DUF488 domain-containing protein [Alphaproteobacteria bacterium]